MVERGGRVVAKVTPDVKMNTVFPIIHERVLPASIVYTDEYATYDKLATETNGYVHQRIQHAQKVYVMGDIHTNTIEGFWSLLKRGIGGVYHSSARISSDLSGRVRFRYNRRLSRADVCFAFGAGGRAGELAARLKRLVKDSRVTGASSLRSLFRWLKIRVFRVGLIATRVGAHVAIDPS